MQIKVLVVYLCMGLVSLILGTIAVRAVVAFTTWLVAGRALWLLPNALSDVRRPGTVVADSYCCHGEVVRLLGMRSDWGCSSSQRTRAMLQGFKLGQTLHADRLAMRGGAATHGIARRIAGERAHVTLRFPSALASNDWYNTQEVGLDQAFWPLWELEEVGEDWWWGSNILMRLGLTATTALALWGLATVSPGKGALKSAAQGSGQGPAHHHLKDGF